MDANDIKLVNDDLFINPLSGDFQIAPSDPQHIKDITYAFPGWWKEFPNLGIGIQAYLNSSGKTQELKRNALVQLKSDGYSVTNYQANIGADDLIISTDATRL